MDWAAVARILGERSALPLVLLDQSGRIVLFNPGMEQVLGWSRFEAEGREWLDLCVPTEQRASAACWLNEAMRGALRAFDVTGVAKHGGRVAFHFEFSLVGRGAEQGLLITAKRAVPEVLVDADRAGRDLEYDVSVLGSSFGQVLQARVAGQNLPVIDEGRRCFNLLYGRDTACDDCPLRAPQGASEGPRYVIRHRRSTAIEGGELHFEIRTMEPVNETTTRIHVRNVSERTLSAIHQAKLDQVADECGLSQRERDVMRYLLMGRSIDDIATILEITPRTVKYHQANVLEKVGADSRVDLVRILF